MPNQPLPWERQPTESADAWSAFRAYRDLPPAERSLSRIASEIVAESTGKVRQPDSVRRLLARWSSQHNWQDRTRDWDREVDRRARDADVDEIIRMRKRHASYMRSLMEAGIGPAIELVERIKAQKLSLADMTADDLYRLTVAFARVAPGIVNAERAARGELADVSSPVDETPVVQDASVDDQSLMEIWAVLEDLGVYPAAPGREVLEQQQESPDQEESNERASGE